MTTLLQHIESLNAKADIMMEQEPGLWMSKYTDDMSHWYNMGIYTVEDFRRNELINGISDASKDLYGCRLRLDWDEMTTEDLQNKYDSICESLRHEFEREQEWEREQAEEARIAAEGLQPDCEPFPYEEYAYLEEVA
jgi:hypothetical protein